MTDTTDQTIANPQSLVDAALSSPPAVASPPALAPSGEMPPAEEMPLGFVNPPPTSATTTTTTSTQPVDDATTLPPVPPVPPAPSATELPKKKGSLKRTIGIVLGVLVFGTVISVGGLYAYMRLGIGEPIKIAKVQIGVKGPVKDIDNKEDCNGESNGGWLVWRNGGCKVTGISGNPDKNTENPNALPAEVAPGAGNSCGTGYAYCGGGINKCVSEGALVGVGGGCNKYGEVVYGIPTVYGANYQSSASSTFFKGCDCDNNGVSETYFDKDGYCNQKTAPTGVKGDNYNTMGLCAVSGSYASDDPNAIYTPRDPVDNRYTCTDLKCTALVGTCTTLKYTCSETVGGNSCSNTSSAFISQTNAASSTSFTSKCGTVEQLDVMCGGKYATSRTKINPPCSDKETTTTSSSMACTGITRAPTTVPAIGDVVSFTCSGTVTPSTAGTLSYKYRYSINGGTYIPMTSNTLTVAACGTYSVQCQACATLDGVLTCDPTWTGATQ